LADGLRVALASRAALNIEDIAIGTEDLAYRPTFSLEAARGTARTIGDVGFITTRACDGKAGDLRAVQANRAAAVLN
jgi:hypothetical protein